MTRGAAISGDVSLPTSGAMNSADQAPDRPRVGGVRSAKPPLRRLKPVVQVQDRLRGGVGEQQSGILVEDDDAVREALQRREGGRRFAAKADGRHGEMFDRRSRRVGRRLKLHAVPRPFHRPAF
jgi:hypothetical protein